MTRHRAFLFAAVAALSATLGEAQTEVQRALDEGALHYREGRFAEAAAAFERAAELAPGALETWQSLGWAYRKAGEPDRAIEVWKRILKIDPGRTRLWTEIGIAYMEREAWREAAEHLEEGLANDPEQVDVWLRLATSLEKAGREDEAARAYQSLVRYEPESLTAVLRLSAFHERAGDDAAAERALRDAQARLPRLAHIFELHLARLSARRGDRAYAQGRLEEAASAYRDAVQSNPRGERYLTNLGWTYRKSGELAEAVRTWELALLREPDDAELTRNLADAERERGNVERAKELYRKAWDLAPGTDAVVPFRLSELALAEGREDDARRWLDELFRFPDADEVWTPRVTELYRRFGPASSGLAFLESRLDASTSPRTTRASMSRLESKLGELARYEGDNGKAAAAYRRALELDPANQEALRDLGWTAWLLEEWETCRVVWERLAELRPNDARSFNLLTHLHLYLRDFDDAVETARRSLALEPGKPDQELKLAKALFWSEHYSEGKALAEKLAAQHPQAVDVQRFWGELLMQYHDFERGLEVWERVIALGDGDARAQFYRVKSMYELGRYDESLEEARRLAHETEPHEGLLRLLADDALQREALAEAAGWYQRLTELVPERVEPWLELARLQMELDDLSGASATLESASRHHAGELDVELARANVLRRQGWPEHAHASFMKLLAEHPENREVFWGAVQTASESGRPEEALALLERNRATFFKPYELELERARLRYATGDAESATRLLQRLTSSLAVPALLYHGLGEHERTPAMPVSLFESQMKALKEAGYTAVTVAELAKMVSGELELPDKPILVTFDDARIDSFVYADPVLEAYGMKATMFVPTGLTVDGHPFFADWQLMHRYAASGRWDLQSHGHRAHDLVPVAADGREGSFLVNRIWLPEEGRLETEEEYRVRVERDYQIGIEEIQSRLPQTTIVGYAFPFSEAGQENQGNVDGASSLNQELLSKYFRFGFVQDSSGYNEITNGAPVLLRRLGVPRFWTGEELLRHLSREHPRSRAMAELGRIEMWTGDYGDARSTWARLASDRPLLSDEAEFYLASIEYQRGSFASARRHLDGAKRLGWAREQDIALLERRLGWQESTRVVPRFELFGDSVERSTRSEGLAFQTGALLPFTFEGAFGNVRFGEGALDSYDAREGELGIGFRAAALRLDGRVRRRDASGVSPDSLNYWATAGIGEDRFRLLLRYAEEDIDTLRARVTGIEQRSYRLQQLTRFTRRWTAELDAHVAESTDGNERNDYAVRLAFRPWLDRGWRLGASGGYSDSGFQTPAYYNPEELTFGRGLVGYRHSWPTGSVVDAALELGWGKDAIAGERFTVAGRGRIEHAWALRLRTSVDWSFGRSPGYQSWALGFGLHFGFAGLDGGER